MRKSKAKAGLRGMNPLDKAVRASIIHSHMNGNPLFPDPSPSMAEFGAAIEELRQANVAAQDRGRMALQRRDAAAERITTMISRLANYVNSLCEGDGAMISAAGFILAKKPEPISTLHAPRKAQVRMTVHHSRMLVKWERVPGALIYQVEEQVGGMTGAETWQRIGLTTRPTLIVDGRFDQTHTYRVCAVGTKAQSPYAMAMYNLAV